VENFGQVDSLPLVLAGLLAVLAASTLAHTLLTAVRRRRRDLAILKTLGFVVPQVRWAVVWQATTVVTLALVVGIPVGVAVGRWGWVLVADQLGAVAEPVTPPGPLLVLVPGAILVANLVAAVPAYLAGRTRPALLLRTE
jgi:predicted lysophospholipase L1 biosynthesis ABC-type transport system permease subunit